MMAKTPKAPKTPKMPGMKKPTAKGYTTPTDGGVHNPIPKV
jgi:hypothetical protein